MRSLSGQQLLSDFITLLELWCGGDDNSRQNNAGSVRVYVPDPRKPLDDLAKMLDDDGLLFFSTELSDGRVQRHRRIDGWYVSPRNGHISIYSRESLRRLAERAGFRCFTLLDSLHVFWRNTPAWAAHILPAG